MVFSRCRLGFLNGIVWTSHVDCPVASPFCYLFIVLTLICVCVAFVCLVYFIFIVFGYIICSLFSHSELISIIDLVCAYKMYLNKSQQCHWQMRCIWIFAFDYGVARALGFSQQNATFFWIFFLVKDAKLEHPIHLNSFAIQGWDLDFAPFAMTFYSRNIQTHTHTHTLIDHTFVLLRSASTDHGMDRVRPRTASTARNALHRMSYLYAHYYLFYRLWFEYYIRYWCLFEFN